MLGNCNHITLVRLITLKNAKNVTCCCVVSANSDTN